MCDFLFQFQSSVHLHKTIHQLHTRFQPLLLRLNLTARKSIIHHLTFQLNWNMLYYTWTPGSNFIQKEKTMRKCPSLTLFNRKQPSNFNIPHHLHLQWNHKAQFQTVDCQMMLALILEIQNSGNLARLRGSQMTCPAMCMAEALL